MSSVRCASLSLRGVGCKVFLSRLLGLVSEVARFAGVGCKVWYLRLQGFSRFKQFHISPSSKKNTAARNGKFRTAVSLCFR